MAYNKRSAFWLLLRHSATSRMQASRNFGLNVSMKLDGNRTELESVDCTFPEVNFDLE